MSSQAWFLTSLGALACGSFAVAVFVLGIGRIAEAKREALPRENKVGALLAAVALVWCVPHARAVAFDWMLPYLYFIAAGLWVLGVKYLDYLFARAAAGLLILVSYFFVHGLFEFELSGSQGLSIVLWMLGALGIAISGKPCWFRDLLRLVARSAVWRGLFAGFFLLLGGLAAWQCVTGAMH
ncbi:MAG: hypothetical protein PHS41_02100 [Victivallaceae bacterium]|nr:hypothetical protein [Victivallaceae bacterium]